MIELDLWEKSVKKEAVVEQISVLSNLKTPRTKQTIATFASN